MISSIAHGWYAVLDSLELKQAPLGVMRFGLDMVFWRKKDGQPVALVDHCPHRSAKLSLGELRGDCIACPFHGFEFTASGACHFVPETGKEAANLEVATFAVRESHGFIWVYWGDGNAEACPLPWFDSIDAQFGPGSIARGTSDWPIHVSRSIENQLDYAHLPYVHRSTIGKGVDIRGPREFELTEKSIKLGFSEGSDKGYFHFLYPNIWTLCILPGRFHQMIAFVPVSETQTRIYLRAYQKFLTVPLFSHILNAFLSWQNGVILNQDRRVVLSQRPNVSTEAHDEKLYPSDKGIAWFRKTWPAPRG